MDNWLVCPACLTIGPSERSLCAHCHSPAAWVTLAPEFQKALYVGNPAWRPKVSVACMPLDGDGQVYEKQIDADAADWRDLDIAGENLLRLRFLPDEQRLQVDGGEPQPVPSQHLYNGWHLRSRLIAVSIHTSALPPVTQTGDAQPIFLREAKGAVRIGRQRKTAEVVLAGTGVCPLHAVAFGWKDHYWLADAGSMTGVFINGKPIVVQRLETGDLVQIAGYIWLVSRPGVLRPVPGIQGISLELEGVGVRRRLQPLHLRLEPREFIAVIGESGAGKSTLIRVLIGEPGILDSGRVLADGQDIAGDPTKFRRRVGYVAQQKVLHDELSAREIVDYSARFRNVVVDASAILRQVGIEEAGHDSPVRELSGGQQQRVSIAAELVTDPSLLILDEPGSGLDAAREFELLRLLDRLRNRGCTVVVVTHNWRYLPVFSRVLGLAKGGRLQFDYRPGELKEFAPAGDLAALDVRRVKPNITFASSGDRTALWKRPSGARRSGLLNRICDWLSQTRELVHRELALVATRGRTWRASVPAFFRGRLPTEEIRIPVLECVVPVIVAPLFFALALHLAVKPTAVPTLGFLAILSVVWLGASLSLMSIVNEREIFNHERLLFLRPSCFIASKFLVLGFLSLAQTLVFAVALDWLRRNAETHGILYERHWSIVYLALIAWAGMGMGLLLSAISQASRRTANFLLPLVMIAQIVFSVQVARDERQPFHRAYGEFTPHQCQSAVFHPSGRRAQIWVPANSLAGSSLGPTAKPAPPVGSSPETAANLPKGWYCWDCYENFGQPGLSLQSEFEKRSIVKRDRNRDSHRPNLAAAWLSYLTISRYGDVVLRTFAYEPDDSNAARFGYGRWRQEAAMTLLLLVIGFPLAALLALIWQSDPYWRAIPRRLTTAILHSLRSRLNAKSHAARPTSPTLY